jgi:hypothetical protein
MCQYGKGVFRKAPFRHKSRERPERMSISDQTGLLRTIVRHYDVPAALVSYLANKFPGEIDPMHEHGPDELIGPLRGTAAWWRGVGARPDAPAAETTAPTEPQAPPKPKKKRRSPTGSLIRKDLVERIRAEIAQGTYDTPERWEAALEQLLDRMDQRS